LQNYRMFSIGDFLQKANHPKFLTFTMKHSNAPLSHQIDNLYKSFRKLRLKKQYQHLIKGGVWFFQIVKSKQSRQWHPHLHCIVTGDYIPQRMISKDWLKITGSSKIVDIRIVKNPEKVAYYVSRYSARPANLSELSVDDGLELIIALHGRRLCGTWGECRCLSMKPPKADNPDEWISIGSWRVVTQSYYFDDNAKTIMDCYLDKRPLPDTVSMDDIQNFIDSRDIVNYLRIDFDEL